MVYVYHKTRKHLGDFILRGMVFVDHMNFNITLNVNYASLGRNESQITNGCFENRLLFFVKQKITLQIAIRYKKG